MAEPAGTGGRSGTTWQGILLLGLVFVLGIVCGAALFFMGARAMGRHHFPGRPGPHPISVLTRELDLDPAQVEEIRSIVERSRKQVGRIMLDSREQIRGVLRPEQQEKFDRLAPRRMRGPGGPPPPLPPGNPPPERDG